MTNTRMLQDPGYDGKLFHYLVAWEHANSPGLSVSGAGNGEELATMSLEFEFPGGSLSTELSDFRRSVSSWSECECNKKTLENTWKHTPRVMTSLLMSSLPIDSTPYQLFRYSNSRDVVASSLSFSRPVARVPWRACSQATFWTGYLSGNDALNIDGVSIGNVCFFFNAKWNE